MEQFETREMEFRVTDVAKREVAGIAVPYEQVSNGEMFARDSVSLDPEAKLMWQHDKAEPIGKIVDGRHTADGFEIRATISDTARGRDAIALLEDGVVNRFSVGFIMRDATVAEDRTRVVTDAYVREVSLVSFPWYEGATVTEVRDEPEQDVPASAEQKGEIMDEIRDLTPELAEVRERIEMVEREVSTLGKVEVPAAPEYRSAGEFLKAIAEGDDAAVRTYAGATTENSVVTPVDVNLIRLVEGANPLGQVFSRGVTPATGMQINYARVSGVVDNTDDQSAEGEPLGYYELSVDTDSVDIKTKGNYSQISRQAIERSTVPYLDSVLRGQAIALGNELKNDLVLAYQATINDQTTAGNVVTFVTDDFAGWAAAILDAKVAYFQPMGLNIDALIVDKNTAKKFLGWEGNPIVEFAGEASRTVGSFDLNTVVGSIAGVPVIVSGDIATDGSDCALVSSLALRQYTSGALRLSQDDVIGLSTSYSLSTYTATAAEFPGAVIPVLAD